MKLERQNNSVYYKVPGRDDLSLIRISCEHHSHPEAEATEAEIVRRVNMHEELVAALRDYHDDVAPHDILQACCDLGRVIHRAEGGAE